MVIDVARGVCVGRARERKAFSNPAGNRAGCGMRTDWRMRSSELDGVLFGKSMIESATSFIFGGVYTAFCPRIGLFFGVIVFALIFRFAEGFVWQTKSPAGQLCG